jgi:hypothetical protein
MNRTRLGALMIVVGVSSCMWACGDDDDDTGPTAGTGGKAGSSTGGNGGKAGSTTGGNGGKAGSTTGGTAGKGGTDAGGEGGTDVGGTAGAAPGGGGAGGEPSAGAGGTDGENGGAGGFGGAGGEPGSSLTLAQACEAACGAFFDTGPADCFSVGETDCNTNCSTYTFDPSSDPLFLTYMQCAATKLTAPADYACGSEDQVGLTATPMWPVAAGECETELCAWTCADGGGMDTTVLARCGCT